VIKRQMETQAPTADKSESPRLLLMYCIFVMAIIGQHSPVRAVGNPELNAGYHAFSVKVLDTIAVPPTSDCEKEMFSPAVVRTYATASLPVLVLAVRCLLPGV
jgi:hypothetical protein